MKVILTFKKAAYDWNYIMGESYFSTIADSSFYGMAQLAMERFPNLKITIKRLTPYDSLFPCKIIFEGEFAYRMAYNWIDLLGSKIKNVKVREK